MPQDVYQHTFPNGLTLLAERMDHVRSATLNFLVPCGSAHDPPAHRGVASALAETITRGAGARDSRELAEALDRLGVDRDEGVSVLHTRFWGGTLARNLPAALEIYADIVLRPHLPEDELEAVQALCIQDLQGLEDEPRSKLFLELRRLYYPHPLGQDRRGTAEGIASLSTDVLRAHYQSRFTPKGTIVSVAGNIVWEPLRDQIGRLFGDWSGPEPAPLTFGPRGPDRAHLEKETTQTQIGLAYPSVPVGHPDYYAAVGAVNVLSGGMSARLFTEVREKRGLCYAVSAGHSGFKDQASIICYAGTTNERAQETLDVTVGELRRLGDGIEAEEVERVKAGLKSSLIMAEESTSARAAALASDWYHLGRVRSSEEVRAAVEALTPTTLVEHVRRYPPRELTVATLGPKPLEVREAPQARVPADAPHEGRR